MFATPSTASWCQDRTRIPKPYLQLQTGGLGEILCLPLHRLRFGARVVLVYPSLIFSYKIVGLGEILSLPLHRLRLGAMILLV